MPRRRKIELVCAGCGATFWGLPRTDRPGGRRYCSRACSPAPPRLYGEANARFNGGLSTAVDGRTLVCCRDGSTILYSRAVAAARIGRLLRSDEIVHHVNEDVTDDRDENLEITTRAEHIEIHREKLLAARGIYRAA